ncbi:MAG: SPOR domain-containing protein [Burkholderiales bacterium]|nr:SPOR domain-containing protein [Burkholderiales bacterium]
MLRLLVLALILANGLYFAWTQGLLRAYGFAPAQQSEPQRLAQQVRPEALRVLTTAEVKRLEEQARTAGVPAECLVAGPFSTAQADALRRALLASLPEGSWQMNSVELPARWIIYMGKYSDQAALEKKRSELAALKFTAEAVRTPPLEMGLSLGSFADRDSAERGLAKLGNRGIRTAKVVQESASSQATELRLPAVTDAIRPRLEAIKPQLAGLSLHSCNESGR